MSAHPAEEVAGGAHVDHSKLVPLLWAAVQELSAQVKELQAEVRGARLKDGVR